MPTSIAVGVDGSADSGIALDWAAAEARRRGATLLIVHGLFMPVVAVPFSGAAVLPPSDELRAYAENLLEQARQRVAETAPGVATETALITKRPSDAVLQAAHQASLLVLGTRGLGAIGTIALGSVSARVSARSGCPTVVVPPPAETPDDGTVVVGVDGSEHSAAALRFALEEASLLDAKVVAVHAYRPAAALMPVFDPTALTRISEAEHEEAVATVQATVDRAVRDTGSDVTITTRVEAGHPATVLIEAGRDAAMTVVGSRGRGEFRSVVLGSVSRSVLQHASRPVAVVRST